jgi:hypothetical protein
MNFLKLYPLTLCSQNWITIQSDLSLDSGNFPFMYTKFGKKNLGIYFMDNYKSISKFAYFC